MSLGRPSGPAMPVKASPTSIALISMLLVPTPWTTRQMVPASASQSASVSGISSPSGRGSTRTNWPACAAAAISGRADRELLDAVGQVRPWRGSAARWCPARCTPGRGRPCRARSRPAVHGLAEDLAGRRLAVAGRRDGRRAAARGVATGVDALQRRLLRARVVEDDRAPLGGLQPRLGVLDDRVGGVAQRHDHQVGVHASRCGPCDTGARRPDSSGSPSSMISSVAAVTKPVLSSPRNSDGARSSLQRRCPPRGRGAAPRRGRASPSGCGGRRW